MILTFLRTLFFLRPLKMRGALGDEPSSILPHILIIVSHALGAHGLLAVFLTFQHYLYIGNACSLVAVNIHYLLTIDVIISHDSSISSVNEAHLPILAST